MRRFLWLTATAAMICWPSSGWGQQQSQPAQDPSAAKQNQAPAQPQSNANAASAPAPKQDSLAAAARKAREQRKEAPKATKVFDNDNIPTSGGINTVGGASAQPGQDQGTAPSGAMDEKAWRERFANLHHKLDQDQQELDILQRELGVANVNFYTDPVKGMQQGLTMEDINKKKAAIDAKQKAIEADKQAISDAEDELRKSGGDPGWAR
jgi:hypothetical protein